MKKKNIGISTDSDVGYHNMNLDQSIKRIHNTGSWKKQRIVTITPGGKYIPMKTHLAIKNLMFPPNQQVFNVVTIDTEVGEAFSKAIEEIIAHPELGKWEYILTIEHDNIPPPDGVIKLLERMEAHPEFACISGLYWTKGEAGVPQIWGDRKDLINFRPQRPVHNQLVECWGTGMGFALWRLAMFKDQKISRPLFKTLNGSNGQGISTQDLYFWTNAQKAGYRCAVDCAVKVGHYDPNTDITY